MGLKPLDAVWRRSVAIALVATLGLVSCGSDGSRASDEGAAGSTSSASTTSTSRPEVDPDAYLSEIERLVRAHAYYADHVDWAVWERDVSAIAAEADRTSDTYGTVDRLVARLDRHSSLNRPESTGTAGGERTAPGPLPDITVDNHIGRIILPTAPSDPETEPGADYVTEARAALDAGACGWIVDLRGGGGNVWTLLMALAPLLGPGSTVGYRYRDGRAGEVIIGSDGSLAGLGRPAVASPERAPIDFAASDKPVAVIQSGRTTSAHERAVMAFRGRAATMSFGTPTAGLPTAARATTSRTGPCCS